MTPFTTESAATLSFRMGFPHFYCPTMEFEPVEFGNSPISFSIIAHFNKSKASRLLISVF